MIKFLGKLALAAAVSFGASSIASADEGDPSYLRIGVGAYDVFGDDDNEDGITAHLEYISGEEYYHFKPFMGVMGTDEKAGYIYAGIRYDWEVFENWIIAPSFAPGIYTNGDGKTLGHAIEFRSAIEVAYEFENQSRLGASLYHLSNAGIGDRNPGTEVVTLHYSFPLTD